MTHFNRSAVTYTGGGFITDFDIGFTTDYPGDHKWECIGIAGQVITMIYTIDDPLYDSGARQYTWTAAWSPLTEAVTISGMPATPGTTATIQVTPDPARSHLAFTIGDKWEWTTKKVVIPLREAPRRHSRRLE